MGLWPLSTNGRAKLGAGLANETANVNGSTVRTGIISANTANGAFLAFQTNIGRHTKTEFVLAPEVGVNVGCTLTECLRLSVGFNALFVNNVLRPGNRSIGGSIRPKASWEASSKFQAAFPFLPGPRSTSRNPNSGHRG